MKPSEEQRQPFTTVKTLDDEDSGFEAAMERAGIHVMPWNPHSRQEIEREETP